MKRVAKHPARCPRCGNRLEVDTAVDEQIICSNCQVSLSLPGKAKLSDKVDPLIGQSLGQFEVIELLGRGGMGAVYQARQASLDRLVALKVLPRAFSRDASFVARFSREARSAAAVSHPNIIEVYDVGEDRGYQYIAMELVDGETLGDLLKRQGRLAAERALELMKQVSAALAEAHAAGILHRDIKPSNILLTARGRAKVADFGLAKRAGADVSVTQTGQALGTPLYMPPEGARGKAFDARSDLYSLGATFYHALAGRPPFEGTSGAELVGKHLEAPVPPLSGLAPHAPPALCHVIHRLLRKHPGERYPSAEELLRALERVEAKLSVSQAAPTGTMPAAAHPSVAEHREEQKQRLRRAGLVAGVSGGAALVLVVVLIFVLGRKRESAPPATATAVKPTTSAPAAKLPEAEARERKAEALFATARRAALSRRWQTVRACLARLESDHPNTKLYAANRAAIEQLRSKAEASLGAAGGRAWEAAWKQAQAKATALVARQRFAEAIKTYRSLADLFDDLALKDRAQKAASAVYKQAEAACAQAERRARELLAEKKYDEARAALRPVVQRFGLAAKAKEAKKLLDEIAAAEKPAPPPQQWGEWVPLFDGKTLKGWKVVDHFLGPWGGKGGEVRVENGQIVLETAHSGTGIAWTGRFPAINYELTCEAMRLAGNSDFCNITFPVAASRCGLMIGGYENTKVALSMVNGRGPDDRNPTTRRMAFESKRWHHVRLRVTKDKVQAWINREKVIDLATTGRRFATSPFHEGLKPLGLSTFRTKAALRNIRLRRLKPEPAKAPLPPPDAEGWISLFDGKTLNGWRVVEAFPGRGKGGRAQVENGQIVLQAGEPMTGVACVADLPAMDYEIALDAMRREGRQDFASIVFPLGRSRCVLYVGRGDGGAVELGSVDGVDRDNQTTKHARFEQGQWYRVRLRVTEGRIEVWIGDQKTINFPTGGHSLAARPPVAPLEPFGVYSYRTTSALRNIRLRRLKPEPAKAPLPPPDAEGWISLFDGKTLNGWTVVEEGEFARHGEVYVQNGQIVLEKGAPRTGILWTGDSPAIGYEIALDVMRVGGHATVCDVVFPVGASRCDLVVGGDLGKAVALWLVDGRHMTLRETHFQNGRWYRVRLRLTKDRIQGWIDKEKILDLPTAGRKFTLDPRHRALEPFGVGSWQTKTALRNIRLRRLKPAPAKDPGRTAAERAVATYAQQSDKVWALFKGRKYAEADKLLAQLAAKPEYKLAANHVEADAEASKLLREFWAAVEKNLSGMKGKRFAIGKAAGILADVKDGMVRVKAGKVEFERPITKLDATQARWLARLRRDPHSALLLAVFLLAEAHQLNDAEKALAAAGESPSVAIYKERLEELRAAAGGPRAIDRQALALIRDLRRMRWKSAAKRLAVLEKQRDRLGELGLTPAFLGEVEKLLLSAKSGLGLYFDGANSWLAVSDGPEFEFKGSLTLEAWIKPEPDSRPQQLLFFRGDDRHGGDPWVLEFPGGKTVCLRFWDPAGSARTPSVPLPASRWMHIAGVLDAQDKEVRLYCDGKLLSKAPCRITAGSRLAPKARPGIGIGNLQGGTRLASLGYRGIIGEVRISKGARYREAFEPTPRWEPDKATVLLLHLDEGEGKVARDSSRYGNHGRILGAKWVDPAKRILGELKAQLDEMETRLRRLKPEAVLPAPAGGKLPFYRKWPFDAAEAKRRQQATARALGVRTEQVIRLGRGVKLTLVLIPAGEFLMGSPARPSPAELVKLYGGNVEGYQRDRPQHRVRITRPFWLGKFEVTQEQWQAVMGNNPARLKGPQNPVEQVSWNDCQAFLAKLNDKLPGKSFRLATEAEWEYACRAGTTTQFSFGNATARLGAYAWFDENSKGRTHPVGQRKPNAWGLCDMHGNVWEWCADWFGSYTAAAQTDPGGPANGTKRDIRGGSHASVALASRSAGRNSEPPGLRKSNIGFRVARPIP